MRQRLGKKLHALCEKISGKKYAQCWTTRSHYVAECWIDELSDSLFKLPDGTFEQAYRDADNVYYAEPYASWPVIRKGQLVVKDE